MYKQVTKANTEFTLISKPSEEDLANKITPQKAVIIDIIDALGGKATRAQILEKLEPALAAKENNKRNTSTQQKPEKILTYYQSQLVKEGVVSIFEPAKTENKAVKMTPEEIEAAKKAKAEAKAKKLADKAKTKEEVPAA